jgi:hypothetical protein
MQVGKNRPVARSKVVPCSACVGAVIVAGFFLNAASLQAATESFTTSIPDSDGITAPTTASFSLPQFNTALGMLTNVEVDFSLNYQAEVEVFNLSGSAQVFSASSSVPILMDTPSVPNLLLVSAAYSLTDGVGLDPAEYPYFGPTENGLFPFDPLSADFPSYEGNGSNSYTLSYGAGTYTGTADPGGGGVTFGGDANSNGSATVTYTYTPVPEPSTLALLVVGSIGLAAVARRRKP